MSDFNPVRPEISKIAFALISESLHKHCEQWREDQLMHEATTAIGMTMNKALIKDLKAAIRSRGKIEREVAAVEDVLIRHWRERNES